MIEKRVAIYARVSTKDQNPENQVLALRDYAKYREWQIIDEFVDKGISGSKEQRPQLDALMDAAKRRKIDIVLVWKFDRFARSSRHLLIALEELRTVGVDFVSSTESVDTSTPAGKMLFTMVSAFAEFERSLIRERVLAGLQRARAKGIRLGRPKIVPSGDVGALRAQGKTIRDIAEHLGVSKSWVAGALALSKNPSPNPALSLVEGQS